MNQVNTITLYQINARETVVIMIMISEMVDSKPDDVIHEFTQDDICYVQHILLTKVWSRVQTP